GQEINTLNWTTHSQAHPSTSNEGSVGKTLNGVDGEDLVKPLEPDDNFSLCSSTSTSIDDDNEYSKNMLFRQRIKEWATERNISQIALNDLAAIVNDRFPGILPRDARTILGTIQQIRIKTIKGGEYWHNGLTKCLKKSLEKWIDVPAKIALNFNFDGLPIFKSSNKEFWPILCTIFERPDIEPFVIGIYYGVGKPNQIDEYLNDFVNEMENLLKDGIYIEQFKKTVSIEIRCFTCDSPARAYIKGVCNFNAKHGCLKCVTVGEYSHVSHTVTFPETNCRPRTDQEFREKKYGPHHKKDSPLLRLPVDMIEDFPVADSLHLVDLGIMKRLLVGWRNGNFGKYITKWSARDTELVSIFLHKCKLPSEIHRSVRGLDCLSHWKASEYRSFLFYLSIVILPDVLSHDAFSHFLAFFCGITICSSKNYSHFLPLAKELLQYFVEHYKDFYGADYVTSNVHNVVHIADEVRRFGPLHTFSAYPFENKLYLIKRMLRHGNKPLAQVAKRFSEDAESLETTRSRKNQQLTNQDPFVTTTKRKR
ncbi:jg27715, partial [Pararge aegeria aegeria]